MKIKLSAGIYKNIVDVIPNIIFFLIIILQFISLPIQGFNFFSNSLIPIYIFFWSITKPKSLSYFLIFLSSLCIDLLADNILGSSAFIYLILTSLLRSQRRFFTGKPFIVFWFGYSLYSISIFMSNFIISIILNNYVELNFKWTIMKWLFSCFLYVPIHSLLHLIKQKLEIISRL